MKTLKNSIKLLAIGFLMLQTGNTQCMFKKFCMDFMNEFWKPGTALHESATNLGETIGSAFQNLPDPKVSVRGGNVAVFSETEQTVPVAPVVQVNPWAQSLDR